MNEYTTGPDGHPALVVRIEHQLNSSQLGLILIHQQVEQHGTDVDAWPALTSEQMLGAVRERYGTHGVTSPGLDTSLGVAWNVRAIHWATLIIGDVFPELLPFRPEGD